MVDNTDSVEWDIDANLPMYTRDYLRMKREGLLDVQPSATKLHGEICTTLSLSQGRGEPIADQAWDVLHEILEASSGPEFEKACALLLAIRNERENGFEDMCTYGIVLH